GFGSKDAEQHDKVDKEQSEYQDNDREIDVGNEEIWKTEPHVIYMTSAQTSAAVGDFLGKETRGFITSSETVDKEHYRARNRQALGSSSRGPSPIRNRFIRTTKTRQP
ncbi:hypothetical protein RRG08_063883, partial [Elysia crispata]